MNKKRLIIKSIFIFLISLSIIFLSSSKKTVYAVTNEETSAISYLGAGVRITSPEGIRFAARVDMDSFLLEKSIEINDIDYYGFVVAFGECDASNLYVGASINGKKTLNVQSSTLFNEANKEFTVVLKGFTSEQYLQNYTVRAYIIYNDTHYAYAKMVLTRSIHQVSSIYEESNDNAYTQNVCSTVSTLLSGSKTISNTISDFDNNSITSAKTRGVITAISSGSTYSFTISDGASQIMVYRPSNADGYQSLIKVGNEILISGTITKYNGVYEITNTSNMTLLSGGSNAKRYFKDASEVFETNSQSDINSYVTGVLQYISTSNKNMNFTTDNHVSVLFYVDSKWSGYTAQTLTPNDYYFVSGIIGYYNKLEIIPVASSPVSSISNLTWANPSNSYDIREFDINDLIININLSNGETLKKPVDNTMISDGDLASLSSVGNKSITVSLYGKEVDLEFALTEEEISSIVPHISNTRYYIGDSFDVGDDYITVNYVNGSSSNRPLRESYVSSFNTSSTGSKTMTVTYGSKSANVNYEVYKKIVIYDVYGAGGNQNATYKYDFVILYNNTSDTIDLSSYYLFYAASGKQFSSGNIKQLTGVIYSHAYYLIRCSSNSDTGSDIPTYNISLDTSMGGSSGTVAIGTDNTITDPSSTDLMDSVSYSTSNNQNTYQRQSLLNNSYHQVSADIDYYLEGRDSVIDLVITGLSRRYGIDSNLDTSGMVVTAIYNSGLQENINLNDPNLSISGFDSSSEGTKTLVITFRNFTTNILYSVSDNNGILDVDIYFIDLGDDINDCGESTYIKVGDDIDILIDAGETDEISANAVKNVINTYCEDNTLEYVIASHAHSDHIGGMNRVLANYNITNVIEFDYKYGSDESSNTVIGYYLRARSKADNIYTAYDLVFNHGNGNKYEIEIANDISIVLYNTGYLNTTGSDKNAQSVVCTFEAYGTRVLFTGDAEKSCEAVYASIVGDIDILKVAHHGTYNATMATTLNYLDPEVAIVCNGNYLGNEYGHPTYDALNRLYTYDNNMKVYAITGANITDFATVQSSGPGATARVLYQYKSSTRSNFYFKCDSPSDALAQRNGNIRVSINESTYVITSEFYNLTPLEIKNTDYYSLMVAHWND
ncbi:MAG: bacterial Ig-like domain-containing protein [Bacilli bacterium]|nr:bacterial Ig-like domain-containing protein [Bacilli bacterium]